ncbi:heme peroxidase family protein [Gilvimarinus sp. DA14]|uniref:peroxidase family protein n=1 Tax=Gilvimarinus sp. DA14 TaxID=2956798 RepID=UPI0020B7CC99|nr:heme peroxidase family protein [Gilvimarinus sp. DA14]UTF58883.1 heme peroxidase family protein [Gilvimarinus sp. DA14]
MSQHHGTKKMPAIHKYCEFGYVGSEGDRFGRLFDLPPLFTPIDTLKALGKKNGPMDGGKNANRTDSVPVGMVFFGQFIDHDITLDVETSFDQTVDLNELSNARTPTLDLDCIYGQGPEASPFLYYGAGEYAGVKLLTGADGTAAPDQSEALAADDLPRTSHGTAIIGDPRNDENRIISQLQLAFIRFHNKVVDAIHADNSALEGGELFEHARQQVTWHYQWCVLTDFLPAMCGNAVVSEILGNGRQFFCPTNSSPFIPVEFSVAAYRFGHSMVPQKIQVQKNGSSFELFGTKLGRGFSPLGDKDAVVDWNELVNADSGHVVQMAEKMDTQLASDLLDLPFVTSGESSLATRNLLRGQGFQLPSGEQVAEAMGRDKSEIDQVSQKAANIAGADIDLSSGTPLWFYLLSEAECIGRESKAGQFDAAEGLGPVGARIVAETMIGLMELDPRSFMHINRNWDPADGVGVRSLGEILTY